MKTLIICEKPASAAKIAEAVAEKRPQRRYYDGVPYYEFERDGSAVVVVSALGHLFALKNLKPMKSYPFYEVGWVPAHEASKSSSHTRNFIAAIRKLSPGTENFVVATDFDSEGSLIGYNILKYLCGEDSLGKARRMKFSTLTAEDLIKSYQNLLPRLDFENAEVGATRHVLDWYWGMNVSLAMSLAIKAAESKFVRLSAGRVQTPTLKILADREKEIAAFQPVPFWTLKLVLEVGGSKIAAEHSIDRFWNGDKAEEALAACRGKPAIISSVNKRRFERPPPVPFNLGGLQSEAYRCFGLAPMQAQKIAQELYQSALISYPRTDSQKLPPTIGFARIIDLLGKISSQYKKFSEELLAARELRPNEGSQNDPAHPSIFPTGVRSGEITGPQRKVYDLIVRRFFSVFGAPALVESTKVDVDVGGQAFHIVGQELLDEGWMKFYGPYAPLTGSSLPKLIQGQEVPIDEVRLEDGETHPPPRYNPASILKEMESKRLGTKGTRAQTLQNLYTRGYITGSQICVTDLGIEVIDSLLDYCPEIASEKLTSRFEGDLEGIREGKSGQDEVIARAKTELDKILENFKQHELEIGKSLAESHRTFQIKQRILGKCECGGDLKIVRSRTTQKRFAGCSNYPACKNSFPLPQFGEITPLGKTCEFCQTPIVQASRVGTRPRKICLDPKCQTKAAKKGAGEI